MRVLGIDPGSERTGWAVVEEQNRRNILVEYGALRISATDRFPARLLKICECIEELIQRFQPDVMSIEDMFFAHNAKSALKLGQVRGVALLTAERAGLGIFEYSPRLVKQTVVGYGNAEKHQVQQMVRVLLSLNETPEPHDAADAIAVAICHLHHAATGAKIRAAEARVKSRPKVRNVISRHAENKCRPETAEHAVEKRKAIHE